jgi:hypothetical protein
MNPDVSSPGPRQRRWSLLVLTALALAAGGYLLAPRHPTPPPATPLPSEVYVWQRAWADPVATAVRTRGNEFSSVVTLARQIQWSGAEPRITRIAVNWPALRDASPRPAAAIRIGAFSGDFAATAPVIADAVRDLLTDARAQHVPLAEIQLDFDAATSKLAGYRRWLAAAQAAADGTPVTITALPSWLSSPEFAPLAQLAAQGNGLVLQVHGLDRPKTLTDTVALCDPAAARKAIARMAKLNVPFRVALPTYSYLLAYDAAGKFLGLAAEEAKPGWAEGKTVRELAANPDELAALVRDLQADRPATLRALIWYRLPVDGDRLNFAFPTLRALMAGRPPAPAQIVTRIRTTADGVLELDAENTGERDLRAPLAVTLTWPPSASLIAADALSAAILDRTDTALRFSAESLRLPPGTRQTLGWLRLSTPIAEQEVHTHVEPQVPALSSDSHRRGAFAAAPPADPGL